MKNTILISVFALAALAPAAALAVDAGASPTVMCIALYKPVCAAHQVQCFAAPCYPQYETYSNSCVMNGANATFIHEGVCTDAETGSVKPTPTYTPPAGCISWYDGCNSCGKNGTGAICTQRACYGTTTPGYCTAYATSTPPAHATTTSATSTPVMEAHGFFFRVWQWLLNLF